MATPPRAERTVDSLHRALSDQSAQIVVMGLGYVGLPMAVRLAIAGFRVTGLDPNEQRVEQVVNGQCYIEDISPAVWQQARRSKRLQATSKPEILASADAVLICVPTPLTPSKDPDTQFIVAAAKSIAQYQCSQLLVILESTTYPGFTEEVLVPHLTRGNFELGQNVFVAFSPERCDPGNQSHRLGSTPKVIGGCTHRCLQLTQTLYHHAIERLVPVSSPQCAEMVKLLENTFRAVNIGLVNEIAIMSRKLGIDAFEVVRAAATKPFGFMPFYPGPGLGGHCIPIDPLYLSWKLRTLQYEARFIHLADEVNSAMPRYVVERVSEVLNAVKKPIFDSKILIYGLAYKRDIADCRQAPALEIIQLLGERGALIEAMDPWVAAEAWPPNSPVRVCPEASFSGYDLVLILTDHTALPQRRMLEQAQLILDTRDALQAGSQAARSEPSRQHVHLL